MAEMGSPIALTGPIPDRDHNTSGSDVLIGVAEDTVQATAHKKSGPKDAPDNKQGLTEIRTKSWGGWVELENHPMIFSALLREWGAPNIAVQEVLELERLFDAKADSIYGLILLSRWAPSETENELTEAPTSVWFANQVQSFSCATVALMNIIMNHSELDLGEELNNFRSLTWPLDPLERGWKLDRHDKIRDTHNSFGTEIDKAKVDHKLQLDYKEAWRRENQATGKSKKDQGKGRKKNKRMKTEWEEDWEEEGEDEENGFHFIAYVPIAGAVWKMDGMERLPRKLGQITAADSWISPVLGEVLKMRETAEVNQFEVSLLSLVQRTDNSGVAAEIEQMEDARQDWGPLLTTLLKLHSQRGDLKEIMGNN